MTDTDIALATDISPDVAQTMAIIENARRLGLIWTLRPGRVVSVGPLKVLPDGDVNLKTEPLGMVSLIGALWQQARVMTLYVPPGGNVVIGIGDRLPIARRIAAASRGLSLTTVTTSIGTELDLGWFQLNNVDLVQGIVYEIKSMCVAVTQTVATDSYQFRFRLDTALTGLLVGIFTHSAGTVNPVAVAAKVMYEATDNVPTNIFISVVRQVGTGTATLAPRVSGGNGGLASYSTIGPQAMYGRNVTQP